MRRFPLIGLTISLLLLPTRANASVPDPRVRGGLVGGTGPSTVASAVGDVTGDGIPDLIVARGADAGAEAYTVAVFTGPLTGPLPTDPSFTVTPAVTSDEYKLAVGDLNHDGNGDLAVAAVNGDPSPEIDVFWEAGGALLSTPSMQVSSGFHILDLAVADMDGDGWDDLLFTRKEVDTPIEVRLRTQKADATFVPAVVLAPDVPVTGLSVGDVNNDGLNDFSLDGSMTGSVPVFVQSAADHTFSETDVPLDTITGVSGAVLSDVNDDANDDLLVVTDGDGLAWALADGTGGFGAFSVPMAASAVSAKEVADLNGDGRVDLATFGGDGLLRIYLQQSDGGLGAACSFPGTSTPGDDAATSTGDLTSDGAADIVDADVGGTSGGAWLFEQLAGSDLLTTSVDAQASDTSMQVFETVTISGTFHNPEGGCLRQDSVSLSRSGPDGTADLGSAAFAGDGSFSFQDAPGLAGDYTYTVSFAGDETHETSTSSTLNVQVTKIPTSLSLHVSDDTITYGDGTKLSATLHGGSPTSDVVFQRKGNDGDWHSFDVQAVGNGGVATIRVEPSAETRYRAAFLTTPNRVGSVSSSRTVQVHAVMRSRMIGKSTKDGRYTVYKCCTAYFWVKLWPLHPSVKWVAAVQYYGHGKWRPLGKATYRIERDGDAAIFLNAVTGYRYRVRGHFDGDADHLGATSKWNYFKYK